MKWLELEDKTLFIVLPLLFLLLAIAITVGGIIVNG